MLTDGARLAPGRPVLLLGTPRSGNTLLQRLFHELLGFPVLGAPTIDDIDVSRVDSAVFIQMHAPHSRAAERFVDQLGARVVTIARHPLDVLISILHFSRHERQILDWLDGAGIPSPDTLAGAAPTSDEFVDWAAGKGAARLLGVTHGWWRQPDTRRIYYEDLISDTSSVMATLIADLDLGPELDLERRLVDADADELRQQALLGLANHHRWRGKANGWREFLTRPIAERLHDAHRRVFDDLGYTIDGSTASPAEASAAWAAHVK
ncbi:MAG: sulfotransferase domain-containing protein [Acidimicrobiales bacterium]